MCKYPNSLFWSERHSMNFVQRQKQISFEKKRKQCKRETQRNNLNCSIPIGLFYCTKKKTQWLPSMETCHIRLLSVCTFPAHTHTLCTDLIDAEQLRLSEIQGPHITRQLGHFPSRKKIFHFRVRTHTHTVCLAARNQKMIHFIISLFRSMIECTKWWNDAISHFDWVNNNNDKNIPPPSVDVIAQHKQINKRTHFFPLKQRFAWHDAIMIGGFSLSRFLFYLFLNVKKVFFYSSYVLQDVYLHHFFCIISCLILRIVRMQLMMSTDKKKSAIHNASINCLLLVLSLLKMHKHITTVNHHSTTISNAHHHYYWYNKNASMAMIIKVFHFKHSGSFVSVCACFLSLSSAFNQNSKVTRNC